MCLDVVDHREAAGVLSESGNECINVTVVLDEKFFLQVDPDGILLIPITVALQCRKTSHDMDI